MKAHVVREAFSLNGVDYPRGTELVDEELIAAARKSHPGHVVQGHHDIPQPSGDETDHPES